MSGPPAQFRITVGSYEHNLLCLALVLPRGKEPVFTPVFHFQAHTLSIKAIDVAKRYLVTGSNDEHIRIYDLQKRKELGNLLSHQGTVTTLRFSADAGDADRSVKSGKWLLSGSDDGRIIIWRTRDWELFGTLKGHQGRVNDVDIHPSGRLAISVGADSTVRLWNLMTAKKAAVLKIRGRDHVGQPAESVRWTADGSHFVVGLLTQLFVYALGADEAHIARKLKYTSTLMCAQPLVVAGVEYLATGHANGAIEFLRMDALLSGAADDDKPAPAFVLRGHSNRVKGMAHFCSADETNGVPYLVSVCSDGKVVVWDLSDSARDQVAVYDTGERLNCVAVCGESVEKPDTMKRRWDDSEKPQPSESEYETDGEDMREMLAAAKTKKKKAKKHAKPKVSVTLE